MQHEEIISVIVPVFNVEIYLDRCISSIVCQTYECIEIILVDDGSTDSCPIICDEWARKDCRIKVIHQNNQGLGAARNAGINISNGKYITFVDSDDWLELDAMEHLLFLLKKYDADYVMGENSKTYKKKITKKSEVAYSNKEFLNFILKSGTQKDVQYAWAKLYKKSLFKNVQYPVGLTSEDIPVIFELTLKSERIVFSTKIIYHYYENPDSITRKKLNDTIFDLITVWELVKKISMDYQCEESIKRKVEICKKRSTLGILCNIAIANFDREEIRIWENKPIVKMLIKTLKNDKWILLQSNIPISRKILVILFCLSFNKFSRLIRKIYLLVK